MNRLAVLGCSASVCALVSIPADSAEWSSGASVTPGVTYTDNVCLSASDEQGEWIGLVTPAGSLRADGNRANLNINASVEINSLTDSRLEELDCSGGSFSNRSQFAPRLSSSADVTLIENWFYIDGAAYISQNQVSPFVSGGDDSLDRTGNTNTTSSYTVSPYISRQFKDAAELTARYTWDEQFNSTDAVRDTTKESAQALITSVTGVSKFSWGLQGDYSNVSYENSRNELANNQDSELKSAQLNLAYQLTRSWQVNGFYGNEWNDFVSTRDEIDGNYWDIGIRWTPNSRTIVEAGVGDRFFGENPRFSISHRHKRSVFSADYAKTLTYSRDIRTLGDAPGGEPGLPPPPPVDSGLTTITNSPILDERFTLGYTFQGRRTGFGASAFLSEQTEQRFDDAVAAFTEATYRGVSVSANRSLSNQVSIIASFNWNDQVPKSQGDRVLAKSETWRGSMGLQQQLSQQMKLGLNYQYTDRRSANAFNDYTENRITLDLRIDF